VEWALPVFLQGVDRDSPGLLILGRMSVDFTRVVEAWLVCGSASAFVSLSRSDETACSFFVAYTLSILATVMPKAPLPNLPVSALFGVIKPSGPTSMAVINNIKRLVSKSRLFVEPSKMGLKGKSRGREAVKLGQGGTLDPLADGVLGGFLVSLTLTLPFCHRSRGGAVIPKLWEWVKARKN
jgi:hypothetical protein